METWTKAQLASKTLEFIKVKALNQSVDASQTSYVQDVIDSKLPQWRSKGLAPFLISAIPEWAQHSLVKILAEEVAPVFGKTGYKGLGRVGIKELRAYTSTKQFVYPVRGRYF